MKIARFFAAIFAVIGMLLMVGTAGLCFAGVNANVRVLETPKEAISCADALVKALDEGDLEAAAQLMYGQPDLGVKEEPSDPVSEQLWEKYREEMACASANKLYLKGSDFMRDVTITVLDVSSITGSVPARAKVLLEQQVAAATDMNQLYDAENNFRTELVDQVMQQALEQAIREDGRTVTVTGSVKVINRDGQWWAVPDQALLNALNANAA